MAASHAGMRPVDWGFVAAGLGAAVSVFALVTGRAAVASSLALVSVTVLGLLVVWSRRHPGPMPYAYRWILRFSPMTTSMLKRALVPRSGERLLEIGPGVGHHALAIAADLLPGGEIDVVDVQQEMLDAVMARVRSAGIGNVFAMQGNATALPYEKGTFDAAYLSAVLGEIPNRTLAMSELNRVLKPGGRLVVAEVVIDPDYISLNRLVEEAAAAGFTFEQKAGSLFAYAASFRRGNDWPIDVAPRHRGIGVVVGARSRRP